MCAKIGSVLAAKPKPQANGVNWYVSGYWYFILTKWVSENMASESRCSME